MLTSSLDWLLLLCSVCSLSAVGAHVYRVQLRAASGKFLTCDLKDGLLVAKSDTPGPDSIFELHRCGSSGGFAVRSPFGRFLNVDENIEMALKEKSAKDPGLRCDRDGGAGAAAGGEQGAAALATASLGPSETSFEIVEHPLTGQIGIRVPQDYFISVGEGATPAEAAKTRLAKNAVAAAATLAAANKAAEIEAARAAAIAAAVAAVTPAPVAGAPASGSSAAGASRSGAGKGGDKVDDAAAAALAAAIASATATAAAAFAASLPPAPSSPPLDFALSPAELLTPTWLDDRSPLSLAGCFALRTAHGRFWCADLASSSLIANRTCVSLWERWVLEPQGLKHVAFRNAHGFYLNLPSPPPAAAAAAAAAPTATGTATVAGATKQGAQSHILLAPQHTLSFVAATPASVLDPTATTAAAAASAPGAPATGAPAALSPALPPSALFTAVALDKPRGVWAFRASNGCYLSAAGNLSMAASAREVAKWERFELQPCDKEIG